MLNRLTANRNLSQSIKVLSTLLITGALGLELGNLASRLLGAGAIAELDVVFWIGRVALISHGIEAVIAAIYTQQQSPLRAGIYTFLVGTVWLVECFSGPEPVAGPSTDAAEIPSTSSLTHHD